MFKIDDILIMSKTPEEHENHFARIYQAVKDEYDVRVKVYNCLFGVFTLEFNNFQGFCNSQVSRTLGIALRILLFLNLG